jgi:hypothetical protein
MKAANIVQTPYWLFTCLALGKLLIKTAALLTQTITKYKRQFQKQSPRQVPLRPSLGGR